MGKGIKILLGIIGETESIIGSGLEVTRVIGWSVGAYTASNKLNPCAIN